MKLLLLLLILNSCVDRNSSIHIDTIAKESPIAKNNQNNSNSGAAPVPEFNTIILLGVSLPLLLIKKRNNKIK